MSNGLEFTVDPALDLVLERVVDARLELVWQAWTRPELIKRWFTPAPWKTVDCSIDLRPGGVFSTTMCSPEGEVQPASAGCYLEIVEHRRLVWTDALLPGYRPAGSSFMTAAILLEPKGSGTLYKAICMHSDPESRKQHEDMGFHMGWGKALDQLVELTRELG